MRCKLSGFVTVRLVKPALPRVSFRSDGRRGHTITGRHRGLDRRLGILSGHQFRFDEIGSGEARGFLLALRNALSLMISRQLARMIGGDVFVDISPGHGSRYTRRLFETHSA